MEAIRIIQDEHRSLAAVLHGMLYLVHQIRDRGTKPDFDLFGAMIYYIDAFPERFHHPKEDQYLFRLLRIRHRDAAPLLDRLKTEHRVGAEKIRTLEQALARYEQGGASDHHRRCAHGDRLESVGAALEAAIDQHRNLRRHGVDDRRQGVHRGDAAVEAAYSFVQIMQPQRELLSGMPRPIAAGNPPMQNAPGTTIPISVALKGRYFLLGSRSTVCEKTSPA